MSPEYYPKGYFERRLNLETSVELKDDGFYPKNFLYNEKLVEVEVVSSVKTETRRSWRGEVLRYYFVVRTTEGLFQLKRDELKKAWTIVGKLKE